VRVWLKASEFLEHTLCNFGRVCTSFFGKSASPSNIVSNIQRFLSEQTSLQIPPDTPPSNQWELLPHPKAANQSCCLPARLKQTKAGSPAAIVCCVEFTYLVHHLILNHRACHATPSIIPLILLWGWRLTKLAHVTGWLGWRRAHHLIHVLVKHGRHRTWDGLVWLKQKHNILRNATFKALLTTFKTEFTISLHALWLLSSF
jgi:hypothetical protein